MLSFLPPCFLASSPSIFTPGIPQKPQSTASHVCPCRSACWRRQLRPTAHHLPPAALGMAAGSALPLGAGPGAATHHVHVASCTAWGIATLRAPPTPNPLTYSGSIIRLGFIGVLPTPIALVIESRWFLQFFWSWAFPKNHSPCSALSHHPLVYKGGTRSAILQHDKAFFSSKHQLQQLTRCSWGVEVTGRSPS